MSAASGLPFVPEEAIDNAETLYYEGALRMFRFVKAGMEVNEKVKILR